MGLTGCNQPRQGRDTASLSKLSSRTEATVANSATHSARRPPTPRGHEIGPEPLHPGCEGGLVCSQGVQEDVAAPETGWPANDSTHLEIENLLHLGS